MRSGMNVWGEEHEDESRRVHEQNLARKALSLPPLQMKKRQCSRCGTQYTSTSQRFYCRSCMERMCAWSHGGLMEH